MINILKLSKKERLGAYLAFLFLIFAFLDRVVISPISFKLNSINSEIKILEKAIRVNLEILAEKDQIQNQLQKYLTFTEKRHSDEEEMAFMLSEVEFSAGRANITLTNVKPQPPIQIAFYRKYQADIEAIGPTHNLLDFLYRLRSSKQLLKMERLKLIPVKKKKGVIKAQVLISRVLIP